ncbi:hypothetical protein E4U15_006246 [Claviceps sp. LM218 group G6]|nr:hypothetical protein E4U15_006246 [Claviceps sp. LM218 group G6]
MDRQPDFANEKTGLRRARGPRLDLTLFQLPTPTQIDIKTLSKPFQKEVFTNAFSKALKRPGKDTDDFLGSEL